MVSNQEVMVGRNNRALLNALLAIARVVKNNQNQNHNGLVEFRGVHQHTKNGTFYIYIIVEEVEYWWENTCAHMEAKAQAIAWELKLQKGFPRENVHNKKEIEFLNLKQGNMTMVDYGAKFEDLLSIFELKILRNASLYCQKSLPLLKVGTTL
ncbi:hypothetical protein CR513_36137, partial [Mucuna pruriens]